MKKYIIPILIFIVTASMAYSQDYNRELTISDSLYSINQYEKSLNHALKAHDIALKDEGKESKPYANALNMLGAIYFAMHDFDKAIDCFYKETDAKKIAYGKTSKSYAKALNNLGTVLAEKGKNKEAEPLLREAFQIKVNTSGMNDTSLATSANNLGAVCLNLGMLNEAERYYLLAADLRKNLTGPNSIPYATTMFNLGSLYQILGNYQAAENCLVTSYNIFNSAYGENNISTLNSMSKLAMCYISTGKNEKSKELLERIKIILISMSDETHPDFLYTNYNLAMYYWNELNYEEAIKLLEETRGTVEKNFGNGHPLYTSCMNSLGIIYWQTGDLNKAFQYLSTTVKLREQIYGKTYPDYATSLHNLAAISKELGNYKDAENKYKEALNLYLFQVKNVFPYLSEIEKAKFYENIRERFDMFFLYVLSRRKENPQLLSDMYDYRLATKGILLDATRKIRNQIASSNNPSLILSFNEWKNTKEKLSRFYSMTRKEQKASGIDLAALESEANKLEKKISSESKVFGDNYNREQVKWQDIQLALNPGEAAVEIIRINNFDRTWTDTVYYAALIITKDTKDHPKLVLLNNGYDLDKYYIRNYLNSIRFQIDDNDSYGAFWSALEQELPDIKKVYISLDGVFNKININTILRPYHDYVIDYMNIVIVQNTADILNTNVKTGQEKSAFILGNPKYSLSDEDLKKLQTPDETFPIYSKIKFTDLAMFIPDLPGTQTEIDNINKQLITDKWKVSALEKTEASEENFKNIKKAALVHLATHGFFLQDINNRSKSNVFGVDIDKAAQDPMLRSGLLFSGATNSLSSEGIASKESENGILTAYEAASLDFDAVELLVMSACETGLGEIKNGEGVYGLQRAFSIAGAKKIIMSLWKVNDRTTQELMSLFYASWLAGENIDEALRKAQLKVKEEWPNPYYWGGFINLGRN